MIILVVALIFIVVFATNFWFGLWNNVLTLINFFIAAMIASAYYENVAAALLDKLPSYSFLIDFIALWLIFFLTLLVLRGITGALSKVQLKFNFWVDMAGRGIVCTWLSIAFSMFACFSLHLAPIPPNDSDFASYNESLTAEEFAAKGAQGGKARGFSGLGRQWMAFVQSRSRGALAASKSALIGGEYDLKSHPDDANLDCRVFDPRSRMALRRQHINNAISTFEKLRFEEK